METLVDTTAEPFPAVTAPSAVDAPAKAAARERLIQREELLLHESGTTETA